jgi:hypothetical protein
MNDSSNSGSESLSHAAATRNERLLTELRERYGFRRATAGATTPVAISFEVDGQVHSGTLIEFSEQGARLASDHKPEVGSKLRVGRLIARVIDRFQDSIAIEFLDIAE